MLFGKKLGGSEPHPNCSSASWRSLVEEANRTVSSVKAEKNSEVPNQTPKNLGILSMKTVNKTRIKGVHWEHMQTQLTPGAPGLDIPKVPPIGYIGKPSSSPQNTRCRTPMLHQEVLQG